MRHLRSIIYALVLAPSIWILAAVGFTHDLSSRGRELFAAESITGLLLLIFAGILFAILAFAPVSPAGPVLAGAAYLGVTVWAWNSPAAYAGLWAPEVAKEGFDLSRPGYGLAALLAIPLLGTALSARRWARYEPPVLPIIGEIRFRGSAKVVGIPASIAETTVLRTGASRAADLTVPMSGPAPADRTVAIPPAVPADAADRTVAMPPLAPVDTADRTVAMPPGAPADTADRTVAMPPGAPADTADRTVAMPTVTAEAEPTTMLAIPAAKPAAKLESEPTAVLAVPAEAKPAEPKPTEPKPTEAKPAEPKPTEPKPTEAESTEAEPTTMLAIPAAKAGAEAEPTTVLPAQPAPQTSAKAGASDEETHQLSKDITDDKTQVLASPAPAKD